MEKLQKLIKNEYDYERFIHLLVNRMLNNEPVTNNGMLDGANIMAMVVTKNVKSTFLNKRDNVAFDGTIKILSMVFTWIIDNEEKLCEIFKNGVEK